MILVRLSARGDDAELDSVEAAAFLAAEGEALRELGLRRRARLIAECGRRWRRESAANPSGLPDGWLAPDDHTPEMLRWGLDAATSTWEASDLVALVGDELADADLLDALPRAGGVLVVLAATVPPAAIQAIVLVLLAGRAVVVRSATALAPMIRSALRTLPEALRRAIVVVESPDHSRVERHSLCALVSTVVVHGSTKTEALWREAAEPRCFVGYGHKVSAAIVAADATDAELRGLAWDLCAWDQHGCLSPQVAFVIGSPEDAREKAAGLVGELADVEFELGLAPIADSAREAFVRGHLVAAERLSSPAGSVLLVNDAPPPPNVSVSAGPGGRVLRIWPQRSLEDALSICAQSTPWLSAVGVPGRLVSDQVARALRASGVSYIAEPGQMQRPPIRWRHDNIGSIACLFAVPEG